VPGHDVRHCREFARTCVYFAAPYPPIGVLRIGEPFDDAPYLADMRRLIVVAVAITLALTASMIWLMSLRLSTMLRAITVGARRFAEGDLAHRITPPSDDQMGALADALNRTAEHLERRIVQLRAQRAENEAILRSMTGALIALDRDQRVLQLNPAAVALLGATAEQARGRLLQEIVRQPELNQFVAESFEAEAERVDEFEMQTDTTLVVRATSSLLRNDDGEPVGLLIFLTDVTQLRRLESMRSDFAANVSHELRTPITNIKGYVETLIETGVDDTAQTVRVLETINRNADRLGAIVDDMLALTKLERLDGQDNLPRSPTRIRDIVEGVRAQLGAEARAKDIEIKADIPSDLRAEVNARLIEQALANLVSNAIKYSPAGTTVTIESGRADPERGAGVFISVADQGPGISPE
ncbi:MAG: histidine kinase dimerization/phospho-acceptor domain-containing protein, partial [Planctomycetota bacterium]|nr:histidine kinase dimerization/phospho-acceptor domain-containing protein [Planctomycetota bacterium]